MKFYYDLHIHSALSPCGDVDMTPNNIVNMALINQLDIIAVSDHNSCKNLEPVSQVAKQNGLVFIAAMELETAEEIHVLCLFPTVEKAMLFENEVVAPSLADIKNDERIFGRQQILDAQDNEIGTDDRYLINATSITIDEIYNLVNDYDGVAIPAHIDKQTKSLISVLGMTDASMGFKTFELSKNVSDDFTKTQFSLKDMPYKYIYNSDAHYLQDIFERENCHFFEFDERPSPEILIKMLKE